MKTIIYLDEKEKNTIQETVEILERYSMIYSASVRGQTGTYHDKAATAAGILKTLLKVEE